jgi:hypothetical protein
MEDNKRRRRARHANTIEFQQGYAFWVSLCPQAASKAVSKGKIRGTKKKEFSHCS